MAVLHSPEVVTRPASARWSTGSAAPKLRDSCQACAASKVKCNKEKPTCARCAKRGMACQYFVTRRAGRKHHAQPSDTTNVTQALPGLNSSTSSETGTLTSPHLIQHSPRQNISGYPDILPNLLSHADPASSSTLTSSSTEFDDFFASPISLPVLETSDAEILTQPYIYSTDVNNDLLDSNGAAALLLSENAFSVIDQAVSELPTLSEPLSPPNSRTSTTSDAQSFEGFRSGSPCSCLIGALGLLKQLFPNASTVCTRSTRQGYENGTCQRPPFQSVVTENERTIEAISNMLQCPCSQDGYLLTIMSLIVFKVLGWYAAAARETPMTDDSQSPSKSHPDHRLHSLCHSEQVLQSPTVVGSYCIDGEDQGRMAAQLVLSELHRVQRLLNLLSQRLKGHRISNGSVNTPNSAVDCQDSLSDRQSSPPFSAKMLDQLDTDLRNRLRALSLEIIGTLRRG